MRTPSNALGLLTGTLFLTSGFLASTARAGSPPSLSGGIMGQVRAASGIAQMGATVRLYDRYDQLVRRTLSNEEGNFSFALLNPDLYSIRVTLSSFVPAIRRNIAVAAGSENILQINLASLFSTVDLISSGPAAGSLVSDDWKWVLRSSQSTRPVLSFLPEWNPNSTSSGQSGGSVFSNTTGLVTVSAGDGDSFTSGSTQAMGTAFALATSLFGTSRVLFSGNVGYTGSTGLPTAGFRTSYSRSRDGIGPASDADRTPDLSFAARDLEFLLDRDGIRAGAAHGLAFDARSHRSGRASAPRIRLQHGIRSLSLNGSIM